MIVQAENVSKRYNREWIFKSFNYSFSQNKSYAIVGPNGSGKSTLLGIISGLIYPTTGKISYYSGSVPVSTEKTSQLISYVSPAIELIEEFTLDEHLRFHQKFKYLPSIPDLLPVLEVLQLSSSLPKPLKYFSSGMKQKVKLIFAFFSDSPLIFLDEPTMNLDQKGIDWYNETILSINKNRIVLICSNQNYEYSFCNEIIDILSYK